MSENGTLHEELKVFGKCPEELMHNLQITDGAVRLYTHMHWRYGSNKQNFEGRLKMADALGVSEKTISNRIAELEADDWIVTVEKDFDPETGNYTTPHYHIFVDRKACKKFRETHKLAADETIRAKPAKSRTRKSRRGIGGVPYHENLSSPGDHENSSSVGGGNLSSHYLDSAYPDSKDSATAKKAVAVALDDADELLALQRESDSGTTGAEPTPAKKKRRNPIANHFEALARAFGHDPELLWKSTTAKNSFLKSAHEIDDLGIKADQIPALYVYMEEKAEEDGWNSFSEHAVRKYAPNFVRDTTKTNGNGHHPPTASNGNGNGAHAAIANPNVHPMSVPRMRKIAQKHGINPDAYTSEQLNSVMVAFEKGELKEEFPDE